MALHIIEHPVIKHKMTIIRRVDTSTYEFRKIVQEIGSLMTYEITRDLKVAEIEIETPITKTKGYELGGKKLVVVPILRAGLGMVEGITSIIPAAKIGHIGLYRDEETLEAVEYFAKFPPHLDERDVLLVDPMLATGASAIAAIDILKKNGATNIKLVSLVGCPEGVANIEAAHPEIDIYLASLDERLNDKGYIMPGLGDAGDRLFGTK